VAEEPLARDTHVDAAHADAEFARLREMLFGREQRELEQLRARVAQLGFTSERLADELPRAIFRRTDRGDRQLAIALAPSVQQALSESVRKHPATIATAIFPILGPAIRKAIGEAMAGLVASVNTGIGQSLSLRGLQWRFEAWRTGVAYAQVVIRHSLVYRVEQVLLIHADTGLLLAHATSPDLVATDGDLISGMLTAIRDFVGDSFSSEREVGGLTSFKVGDLGVSVEPGPQAVLAAVVRGPAPPSLVIKLRETIESIHLRFADPLSKFEGDATPFEPSKELLADCLETVLQSDAHSGKRRVTWWPWIVGTVVLAAALALFLWRRASEWQRAVSRLETEPGIVLVHAERGWRRWRLSGLRDPLAARPAVLLAASGVDTARVDGRWQPYVSLDSTMVLDRARRQLAAPPAVALALRGDTLRARGVAPFSWVADMITLRVFPPGVSHLDLTGLALELTDAMRADIESVQRRRVLFAVASSRVSRQAQVAIDSNAVQLAAVDAALRTVGRRLEIALAGRADRTGLESLNQSLSADRAETVRVALLGGGIPAVSFTTQALGANAPLSETEASAPGASDVPRDVPYDAVAVRARVNRSVSFVVRVVRTIQAPTPER